jgi:hypothetical protein
MGTGPPQNVQKARRYPGALIRTGASYVLTSNDPAIQRKLAALQISSAAKRTRWPSGIASNDQIQNTSPSPVSQTVLRRIDSSFSSLLSFFANRAGYDSIDQVASVYGIERAGICLK